MWKVRAIRGATTAPENTVEAIRQVVSELLDALEIHNELEPDDIISVIFTATRDLDALFPASVARERPHWENIPLLDVQQMFVEGSLERCIRILMYVNTLKPQSQMYHTYLGKAQNLRPDWSIEAIHLQRG